MPTRPGSTLAAKASLRPGPCNCRDRTPEPSACVHWARFCLRTGSSGCPRAKPRTWPGSILPRTACTSRTVPQSKARRCADRCSIIREYVSRRTRHGAGSGFWRMDARLPSPFRSWKSRHSWDRSTGSMAGGCAFPCSRTAMRGPRESPAGLAPPTSIDRGRRRRPLQPTQSGSENSLGGLQVRRGVSSAELELSLRIVRQ